MKKRVFSGARPTGRQHIGNYLGAIQNYVAMQEDYECFYCLVDYHALTTLEETGQIQENIFEMMLDWLAAGLDPEKSVMYVQSHVPEVTELHTLLSMVTPLSWLLRVPTFKDKVKQQPDNVNYGLVGYPVLMTSDIVLYKAEVVPVGIDQMPHIELAREITRRFNHIFGYTFPEPQGKQTEAPLILGLDGKDKMSKSLDNQIDLALTEEETTARLKKAVTDPDRRYRDDPGNPEICNIYKLDAFFNPGEREEIAGKCRQAGIGCVDHKERLAEKMNESLRPLRQRRIELAENPQYINDILAEGAKKARVIAREVLGEVKERMGLV